MRSVFVRARRQVDRLAFQRVRAVGQERDAPIGHKAVAHVAHVVGQLIGCRIAGVGLEKSVVKRSALRASTRPPHQNRRSQRRRLDTAIPLPLWPSSLGAYA